MPLKGRQARLFSRLPFFLSFQARSFQTSNFVLRFGSYSDMCVCRLGRNGFFLLPKGLAEGSVKDACNLCCVCSDEINAAIYWSQLTPMDVLGVLQRARNCHSLFISEVIGTRSANGPMITIPVHHAKMTAKAAIIIIPDIHRVN